METTTSAVIDTPSTSTPSTPTSAPTPAPTPTEPSSPAARPSLKDAIAQATEKTAAAQPVTPPLDAATIPPGAAVIDQKKPPVSAPGPVPTDVHIKALENARVKERTAAQAEFQQQHGEAVRWHSAMNEDPAGFIETAMIAALSNPTIAPRILRIAAQALNGAKRPGSSSPAAPTQAPAPDFRDEHGNEFYSAKAQAQRDDWLKTQILQDIEPLKQEMAGEKARRAEQAKKDAKAAASQQAVDWSKTTLTKARESWPHFTDHEADIKAALMAMPPTSGHPAEEALALRDAYDAVVGPKLSELEQRRVLTTLKQHANASSLNPASTGAPGGVPKNVRAKDGGTIGNALIWATGKTAGR